MEKKPTIQVADLNKKLEDSVGIPRPVKTPKQLEREAKQKEKYWNSMITRKEAVEMVNQAIVGEQDKLRLMFVQVKTLTNFLVLKGLCTLEELDELSRPVVEELYGKMPEEDTKDSEEHEATK